MFSVITPTWNRGHLLKYVFKSLMSQTYRNFEWIVADDGSKDETHELVRRFASIADFPVTYIKSDLHVGKSVIDNAALNQVRGSLIVWCDSDDWFNANTLKVFKDEWEKISDKIKCDYFGMCALAESQLEIPVNIRRKNTNDEDLSWNQFVSEHKISGDLILCIRSSLLSSIRFPEVDFYIPESVIWTKIGNNKVRFIDMNLLNKRYGSSNAVSFTKKTMTYNRGRAYSITSSVPYLPKDTYWHLRYARLILNFHRYCIHGEIDYAKSQTIWLDSKPWYFYLIFVFSFLLSKYDLLTKNVSQSHREFEKNKEHYKLSIERFEFTIGSKES